MRALALLPVVAVLMLGCNSQEKEPAPSFDFTVDEELQQSSRFKDIAEEPPAFINETIIAVPQKAE